MSDLAEGPDRDGMPPSISELLRDYQARTGESLHRASERSLESGHQVAQPYLHRLLHGQSKGWPKKPETFAAIATAIGTTELAVVLGFAVEHGVPVRMPAFATQVPPAVDQAPATQREALLAMVWAVAYPDTPARRFQSDDQPPDVAGVEGLIEDAGEGDAGPHPMERS